MDHSNGNGHGGHTVTVHNGRARALEREVQELREELDWLRGQGVTDLHEIEAICADVGRQVEEARDRLALHIGAVVTGRGDARGDRRRP